MCAVPSLPAHPRRQPRDLAESQVGLKKMPGPLCYIAAALRNCLARMSQPQLAAQLHAQIACLVRCPPSPHPPAPATQPSSSQVGPKTMPGPEKTMQPRKLTAQTCANVACFVRCPPSPHAPAPATQPGEVPGRDKKMPGPWGCLSAARHPSHSSVLVLVHVPPAQVGTPCPRGPVTRGRLTTSHTERSRLCTSTSTKP